MDADDPHLTLACEQCDNNGARNKRAVVEAMSHACSTYGFFYLAGHGVTPAQQKKALDCAKRFFELSKEERMEVWIGKCMGKSFRGYEPPGIQTHQEGLLPDIKEVRGDLACSRHLTLG